MPDIACSIRSRKTFARVKVGLRRNAVRAREGRPRSPTKVIYLSAMEEASYQLSQGQFALDTRAAFKSPTTRGLPPCLDVPDDHS